jgi:protein-disulfide isomerase
VTAPLAWLLGTRRRWAYLVVGLVPVLGLVAHLAGRSARAQVDLTVDPAMTRGAANAPVTIVEFSDYQ